MPAESGHRSPGPLEAFAKCKEAQESNKKPETATSLPVSKRRDGEMILHLLKHEDIPQESPLMEGHGPPRCYGRGLDLATASWVLKIMNLKTT